MNDATDRLQRLETTWPIQAGRPVQAIEDAEEARALQSREQILKRQCSRPCSTASSVAKDGPSALKPTQKATQS